MTSETPCQQTILALPWLLNGSLEPAERREVREHLLRCPQCRAELARTRETLALFRPAAGTSAEPRRAAAGSAGRGRILRRLSWAAMIAAVLSGVGGTWLVGTWLSGPRTAPLAQYDPAQHDPAQHDPAPPKPPLSTPAQAPVTAPASNGTSTPGAVAADAAVRAAVETAEVAAPRPAHRSPRPPADRPTPKPSSPQVIYITSFESGAVAPLANGTLEVVSPDSSRISTVDFENGQTSWH